MRARPEIFRHVFGWEDVSIQPDPLSVHVGGWLRTPSIALSYLFAAHNLIADGHANDCLAEVALPVAYLQRHAFELGLKEAIKAAENIDWGHRWLDALRHDADASRPPSPPHLRTHDLVKLAERLEAALRVIGYPPAAAELRDMASRLTEIEARSPERFRYPTVRSDDADDRSFPELVRLELGEVQTDLEMLFERHFWMRDNIQANDPDATLLGRLTVDALRLNTEIIGLHEGPDNVFADFLRKYFPMETDE